MTRRLPAVACLLLNIAFAQAQTNPTLPDLGPNVVVLDPSTSDAQQRINQIFATQERGQFNDHRYAVLLKPGHYSLDVQVGFYTQVIGLGGKPDDVTITGAVRSKATWLHRNATCNFWRSAENLAIEPTLENNTNIWAVSQATALRRVHVKGNITLFDGGWSSGGFLADSVVDGTVDSGSQQQWLSRNVKLNQWNIGGGSWNLVFVGCENAPAGAWPQKPLTIVPQTPRQVEKPYLTLDSDGRYAVAVPALRHDAAGVTWQGNEPDRRVSLDDFYIAKPERDTATSINAALASGKHLLVTPGIYKLDSAIKIDRPDTIVLGLGSATFIAEAGNACFEVADVDGVHISGLILEAGSKRSKTLIEVGPPQSVASYRDNPIVLHDLFARAGGAAPGATDNYVTINANDVIGDNFWLWRADHGRGAKWESNPTDNGLIVNGRDVTLYGLFVEHTQGFQTLWNGEGGRVYFYQSEMPYDPPSKEAWSHDGIDGFASYKVADAVKNHQAFGLGIYAVFFSGPIIDDHAIEVPVTPGVQIHHAVTVRFNGQEGSGFRHVINDLGDAIDSTHKSARIDEWPPPASASDQNSENRK